MIKLHVHVLVMFHSFDRRNKMLIIIALPLNVPRTLPSSLVATESHNFSEMSAATFLAVKQGARRNKQKLNIHIYIYKI